MAKYRNRGGRIVELDPSNRDVKIGIDGGEYFLVEEVVPPKPQAPIIKEKVVLDKKELIAAYITKFDKKPFPGWSAEALKEKIG